MTTGQPNKDKLVNFVAKIIDPKTKDYKPIYTAPDATDQVYGDVLLSDAVDYAASDEDKNCAETGVRAATPKAVKTVNDNANTKLSKTSTDSQEVAGPVTFKEAVTLEKGGSIPAGEYLKGDVQGNADTATKFKNKVNLSTQSGSYAVSGKVEFDGSSDVTIPLGELDAAKLKGVVPLASIPQGALERVISYATLQDAVDAYNAADADNKPFQEGDTVRVTGTDADATPVMYAVVGNPNNIQNYLEYSAATATKALEADKALKLTTENAGSETQPVYFKDGIPVAGKHTIETSVPVNAVFTDTTYDVFETDTDGLVPGPTSTEAKADNLYLKSDGTWSEVKSGVSGVKGDMEDDFRNGDVNLTYENIGAVGLYDPAYWWKPEPGFPYDEYKDYFWSVYNSLSNDTGTHIGIRYDSGFLKPAYVRYEDSMDETHNWGLPGSTWPTKSLVAYDCYPIDLNENAVNYTLRFSLISDKPFDFTNFFSIDRGYDYPRIGEVYWGNPNDTSQLYYFHGAEVKSILKVADNKAIAEIKIHPTGIPLPHVGDENSAVSLVFTPFSFASFDETDNAYTYTNFEEYIKFNILVKEFITAEINLEDNEASRLGNYKAILPYTENKTTLFNINDVINDAAGGRTHIEYFYSPPKTIIYTEDITGNMFHVQDTIYIDFYEYRDGTNQMSPWAPPEDINTNELILKYFGSIEYATDTDGDKWLTLRSNPEAFNASFEATNEYSRLTISVDAGQRQFYQMVADYPYFDCVNRYKFDFSMKEDDVVQGIFWEQTGQFVSFLGMGADVIFTTHTTYFVDSRVYWEPFDTFWRYTKPFYFTNEILPENKPQTPPASKTQMRNLSPNQDSAIYTTNEGLLPGAEISNIGSADEPFNEVHAKNFKGIADTVQDRAITLPKLSEEVGTVAVQSEEPTDPRVKIWIKI